MTKNSEEYFCLNCNKKIIFEERINTCERCAWRNDLSDDPPGDIFPIVIKRKIFEDYSSQVCYPLIEEKDLEELPKLLKENILTFFKSPSNFNKMKYQNIYHNLYKKNYIRFEKIGRKYLNKARLSRFFQETNFLKKKEL